MITKYIKTDNKCYSNSSGSIRITSIQFTNQAEIVSFASYVVEWSNNISANQISNDTRKVFNLSNGTYSYKLKSLIDNTYSSITTISIESPDELILNEIQQSEYSCFNNGYYKAQIIGGISPYRVILGDSTTTINNNDVFTIDNLIPGTYLPTIIDSNNCSVTGTEFTVKNDTISIQYDNIYPPALYDSYGSLEFKLTGYGPFDLKFINNTTEQTYVYSKFNNPFVTEITSVDSFNFYTNQSGPLGPSTDYIQYQDITNTQINNYDKKTYHYKFYNAFPPGNYTMYVNPSPLDNRCSLESSFIIPNISPMNINIRLQPDNPIVTKNLVLTRDIFDTVLIPYKYIVQNSTLWQTIQNLSINSSIYFNINGVQNEFLVVRNMLDKYSITDGTIELLKLGNNSNEWFYYFHISPGVQDPSSVVSLLNLKTKESFDMTLGLKSNEIDSDNPSLIKGSLIINGTGYREFFNGGCAGIAIGSSTDNDIIIEEISTSILKNLYSPLSYDTTINFLQKFNLLTYNIDINNIICDIYPNSFNYLQHIKQLIKVINNSNNYNNIYIYSITDPKHTGEISLDIQGQSTFFTPEESLNNIYSIEYYTFNSTDSELKNILFENNLIKDTQYVSNLDERYMIVRIKDRFNNIPKYLSFNNNTIDYDNHFLNMQQVLTIYNRSILDLIKYGDILVYIGNQNNTFIPSVLTDTLENSFIISTWVKSLFGGSSYESTSLGEINTIESEGLTLSVKISPQNTQCAIIGPKNYYNSFNEDTTFTNLIPGVYIIKGDDTYLADNLLYQNETRIILNNNSNELVNLIFTEYQNKLNIS
jgi:hypothetical protein